jgi:hypothetical protein
LILSVRAAIAVPRISGLAARARRQPHHVETGFLGGVNDVEPGDEALGLAAAGQHRKLVINTQFHRTGPSPHANPSDI